MRLTQLRRNRPRRTQLRHNRCCRRSSPRWRWRELARTVVTAAAAAAAPRPPAGPPGPGALTHRAGGGSEATIRDVQRPRTSSMPSHRERGRRSQGKAIAYSTNVFKREEGRKSEGLLYQRLQPRGGEDWPVGRRSCQRRRRRRRRTHKTSRWYSS